MSDIKEHLVKLGASEPQLQKHIRPILAGLQKEAASFPQIGTYVNAYNKDLAVAFAREIPKEHRRNHNVDMQVRATGFQGGIEMTTSKGTVKLSVSWRGMFEKDEYACVVSTGMVLPNKTLTATTVNKLFRDVTQELHTLARNKML